MANRGRGRGDYYKNLYGRKRGSGRPHKYGQNLDIGQDSYNAKESNHDNWKLSGNSGLRDDKALSSLLLSLEGAGYKQYHSILGCWMFPNYKLFVDKIQSDPYAPPSLCRIEMSQSVAQYPEFTRRSHIQRIATADYISRHLADLVSDGGLDQKLNSGGGWHGKKGGDINIDRPCQQVLERTSCIVNDQKVEVRFTVASPARGRSIEGRICTAILTQKLPAIIDKALPFDSQDKTKLKQHVESVEDQEYLRSQLTAANLIAFVRDGAILPRVSGANDKPMEVTQAVPFSSPASMRVEMNVPNAGRLTGMGIPKGVTLIVGGGFHGKSTLLNAIERGIYNHIPGDGREFVCSDPTSLKIRAEDGRSINRVDIRPFINNLPFGRDTSVFSTQDASGSTSQAANIIEGLEAGSKCLLIDEDTSATNFMIRDGRMQQLVAKEKEPITPFIFKVRSLFEDFAVSTVLVIGGSGDYFQVADHVIMMDSYQACDVTKKAKEIAAAHQEINPQLQIPFVMPTPRIPLAECFDASRGDREKVSVRGKTQFGFQVEFGNEEIDLSAVEQVVEKSQTRSIADAILYSRNKYMNGNRSLMAVLQSVEADFNTNGLDVLSPRCPIGTYSRPRLLEVAAAINRFRGLRMLK